MGMRTQVEQRSRRVYSGVYNKMFKLKYKVTTVWTYILVYGV